MNIALLEAHIGNPGKYNKGQLAYARPQFPANAETVQAALKKIDIDSVEALEQMSAYQEMAGRTAPPAERPAPKADREEQSPSGHGTRSGRGIKRSAWREAMRTCWGNRILQ